MIHPTNTPRSDELSIVDWREHIFALYNAIRSLHPDDPVAAFERFRATRDDLFKQHPATPIPEAERAHFETLPYFLYRHDLNLVGEIVPIDDQPALEIHLSNDGALSIRQIASARFSYDRTSHDLPIYRLEGYAGGIFVPFRDATNGDTTYGAGRYLFDTRKGANLGFTEGTITLDFNFAYNPSCAYDPRWVCPLAPPASMLPIAIPAGERSPEDTALGG